MYMTAQSRRRLHTMTEHSQCTLACISIVVLKIRFHLFVYFVFNQLLHDIHSQVHILLFIYISLNFDVF